MALADLLLKMESGATDTPDTPCSPVGVSAKPAPNKACTPDTPDTSQIIKCCENTTASRWLLHFADRDPVEVACCPEVNHADILERHPDAVAAEPFTPTIRQPSAPLTASEKAGIRAWLALIEETDPATIAELIGLCQRDADARDYFTGRAVAKLPKPLVLPDDPTPEWCVKQRRRQ